MPVGPSDDSRGRCRSSTIRAKARLVRKDEVSVHGESAGRPPKLARRRGREGTSTTASSSAGHSARRGTERGRTDRSRLETRRDQEQHAGAHSMATASVSAVLRQLDPIANREPVRVAGVRGDAPYHLLHDEAVTSAAIRTSTPGVVQRNHHGPGAAQGDERDRVSTGNREQRTSPSSRAGPGAARSAPVREVGHEEV